MLRTTAESGAFPFGSGSVLVIGWLVDIAVGRLWVVGAMYAVRGFRGILR